MKTFLLAAALLFSTSGCSLGKRQELVIPGDTHSSIASDPSAPVLVEVLEAYSKDGLLKVKAKIQAKEQFSTSQAVVGVVGLNEGVELNRQFTKLSEITSKKILSENDAVEVMLEIPAAEVTEFQVRYLWGEEAQIILATTDRAQSPRSDRAILSRSNIAASNPVQQKIDPMSEVINRSKEDRDGVSQDGLKGLSLNVVETKEETVKCQIKPCDIIYTLVAQLENNGSKKINAATVAVGLYWANAGMMPVVPKDGEKLKDTEQEIPLQSLNILPGQHKNLEIKVDQPVPPVRGGGFVPNVRLLKVN